MDVSIYNTESVARSYFFNCTISKLRFICLETSSHAKQLLEGLYIYKSICLFLVFRLTLKKTSHSQWKTVFFIYWLKLLGDVPKFNFEEKWMFSVSYSVSQRKSEAFFSQISSSTGKTAIMRDLSVYHYHVSKCCKAVPLFSSEISRNIRSVLRQAVNGLIE